VKKELISNALEYLNDGFIAEAAALSMPSLQSEKGGKAPSMKKTGKKLIKTLLIAAVITSLLCVSAAAASIFLVDSPQKAESTARKELEKMQELGILSREISLSDEPSDIIELEGYTDSQIYPGRLFKSRYSVREWGGKYSIKLDVDMATGKIFSFTVEANADENDAPLPDRVWEGENGDKRYYYSNFDDLFDPDMTVDRYCSALCEYWGYEGYSLSGTQDAFYGYDTTAPDGSMLLSDICDEAYLTVYFEGDENGAPMYIELLRFPGRVCLIAGTNHAVG